MSRAHISNGVWTRNVPWEKDGEWRTDMFKSVLVDQRLQQARFVLAGGPTVFVPVDELQRVLIGGHDHHYGHRIWGPFNINPKKGTINGQKVRMEVVA